MNILKKEEDSMFITELEELLSRKIDEGVIKQVEACIKSGQDEEPYYFFGFDDAGNFLLILSLWGDGGDYEARIPLMPAAKMTTRHADGGPRAIEEAEALEAIALRLRKWAASLEGTDIFDDVPEEAYEEHAKERASMSEKDKAVEMFHLYCALDEQDQNDTKQ